jgi:hypothetical protein
VVTAAGSAKQLDAAGQQESSPQQRQQELLPTDSALKLESVSASAEFATTAGDEPDTGKARILSSAAEVHGASTPTMQRQQQGSSTVASTGNKTSSQDHQHVLGKGGASGTDQQSKHGDDAGSTLDWFIGEGKDRLPWRAQLLALLDITGWVGGRGGCMLGCMQAQCKHQALRYSCWVTAVLTQAGM